MKYVIIYHGSGGESPKKFVAVSFFKEESAQLASAAHTETGGERMTLNHLRYFLAACRYLNITQAAGELHISQPSLSYALKELEKELGYDLFRRSNHRISLTPEGELFYEKAYEQIQSFDNFRTASLELGEKRVRTVRIGVPAIMGALLISGLLPQFSIDNPDIHLQIVEIPTFTGAKKAEEGEIDFSLAVVDDIRCEKLNQQIVYETSLDMAVNKKNPLAQREYVTNRQIGNQKFVVLPEGSHHYNQISVHFSAIHANTIMNTSQIDTIRYLLKHDIAAAIVYSDVFRNWDEVKIVPLEPRIEAKIGVLWKKEKFMTKPMRKVLEYLTSENMTKDIREHSYRVIGDETAD